MVWKKNIMQVKSVYIIWILIWASFLTKSGVCLAQTDQIERWSLSVNNNCTPLEMIMDIGADVTGVTYLFNVTSDTLNLKIEEGIKGQWRRCCLSVFILPEDTEVLRLNVNEYDQSGLKVVFGDIWNTIPHALRNENSLFELRECDGDHYSNSIIRFKMKSTPVE